MCGIAGIYGYHYAAPHARLDALRALRDRMAARGPDGLGDWISPDSRIALGHRRLSIIDLSHSASQPMKSGDSQAVITFNGEIYNFAEIRQRLEETGARFRTKSDTEVLVELYRKKGAQMLNELRGMFALAIWDEEKQQLFMARDPYGIKPLYYSDDGWTFRFASQVKALAADPSVTLSADPAGHAGFFLWGHVPEPYTLYREIRSLPAGSHMTVDASGPSEPTRYFDLARLVSDAAGRRESLSLEDKVRQALIDSVKYHFVSDVPVAVFLSAGIDSGVIAGLSSEVDAIHTSGITLAFDEYRSDARDEARLAKETAGRYGIPHQIRRLTRSEMLVDLPHFFESMDQPTIDGLNTYWISRAARETSVKVALSGLGADELFGGYSSFHDVPIWLSRTGLLSHIPLAGRTFKHLARLAADSLGISPKFAGMLELGQSIESLYFLKRALFMPWELSDLMEPDFAREGLRRLHLNSSLYETTKSKKLTPSAKLTCLESSLYMRNQLLRDADWAGMAHSVEIRVPFVDSFLAAELAPQISTSPRVMTKQLLARTPTKPLPSDVCNRPKTGFTVPLDDWLRDDSTLTQWKDRPLLRRMNCHWARKWAWVVYQRHTGRS